MMECRQQRPKIGLTKCPYLVDHYTFTSTDALSLLIRDEMPYSTGVCFYS